MENFADRLWLIINDKAKGKYTVFAKEAKLSPSTLQNCLHWGRLPNAKTLINITEVYNVNLHWLLTGNGQPYVDTFEDALKIEKSPELIEDFVFSLFPKIDAGIEFQYDYVEKELIQSINYLLRYDDSTIHFIHVNLNPLDEAHKKAINHIRFAFLITRKKLYFKKTDRNEIANIIRHPQSEMLKNRFDVVERANKSNDCEAFEFKYYAQMTSGIDKHQAVDQALEDFWQILAKGEHTDFEYLKITMAKLLSEILRYRKRDKQECL